ncbi:hypothetical protein H5410_060440 [Solanum commersonii]|uniref:Uncharacterized protein n=1 Tax=Solanum commersonii TaxID=4109 RepID=A0A9J5W579_SOLCO|nr:hypothetical protein H5410_060440 [Solanum commersonii]
MIFLLENSDIQRRKELWKIFHGLYFPGESYKTRKYYETLLISTSVEFQLLSGYNTSENVYNFSKMIIKHIIHIEDWGISSMTERKFSLYKVMVNFTYWDYIQAFNKVLYYNNERHKHTWLIKVCAKIFINPIPNWFLNWWSYHGPTIKILPKPFLKLYKEWVKVSPDLNRYIYFFIEFFVQWIHKWVPAVDFTEEQIPCLYRTYYNNFWDKLMKKDPQTKSIYGQELLDLITKTIKDYKLIPNKGIMTDNSTSVKHMARKISNHGEEEEDKMIMMYLEEVKKKILLNLTYYAKSDSSMCSETSEDMHEAQPYEEERTVDALKKAKGRGKGHISRGGGRSSPGSLSGSSYGPSSNSPILQREGMSLINSKVSQKVTSSFVHLEYIPEGSLLYAELHAYLSQKQSDTFASIAKDDIDDIRSRISIQDGNKEEMIKEYLEEVRKNLLLNITHYEKSYTSMRSETSDDIADDAQEAQPCESEKTMSEDMMSKMEDFLRELEKKDKM